MTLLWDINTKDLDLKTRENWTMLIYEYINIKKEEGITQTMSTIALI